MASNRVYQKLAPTVKGEFTETENSFKISVDRLELLGRGLSPQVCFFYEVLCDLTDPSGQLPISRAELSSMFRVDERTIYTWIQALLKAELVAAASRSLLRLKASTGNVHPVEHDKEHVVVSNYKINNKHGLKHDTAEPDAPPATTPTNNHIQEMQTSGMSEETAAALLSQYGAERCQSGLCVLREAQIERPVKNPAGFLRSAIVNGWMPNKPISKATVTPPTPSAAAQGRTEALPGFLRDLGVDPEDLKGRTLEEVQQTRKASTQKEKADADARVNFLKKRLGLRTVPPNSPTKHVNDRRMESLSSPLKTAFSGLKPKAVA